MPVPTERWDRRFLELASLIGGWSKDRSAGTGCVIVGSDRLLRSSGYNGIVRGIDDEIAERHKRTAKYSWTEPAERNAVYNAARPGLSLEGGTASANGIACTGWPRAIVQAGKDGRATGREEEWRKG